MQFKDKITLAFSGASGAPYGLRLLEVLLQQQFQVYVLSQVLLEWFLIQNQISSYRVTKIKHRTVKHAFNAAPEQLKVFGKDNWFSPVASGSAAPKKMVVCPM